MSDKLLQMCIKDDIVGFKDCFRNMMNKVLGKKLRLIEKNIYKESKR